MKSSHPEPGRAAVTSFLRRRHGVTEDEVAKRLWASPAMRQRFIEQARVVRFDPLRGTNAADFVAHRPCRDLVTRVYRMWAFRSMRSPSRGLGGNGDEWLVFPAVVQDWLELMAPPHGVLISLAEVMGDAARQSVMARRPQKPVVPGVHSAVKQ